MHVGGIYGKYTFRICAVQLLTQQKKTYKQFNNLCSKKNNNILLSIQ